MSYYKGLFVLLQGTYLLPFVISPNVFTFLTFMFTLFSKAYYLDLLLQDEFWRLRLLIVTPASNILILLEGQLQSILCISFCRLREFQRVHSALILSLLNANKITFTVTPSQLWHIIHYSKLNLRSQV